MPPERDQPPPPRELVTDARRPVRTAELVPPTDINPRPLAAAIAAAKGRILTHAKAAADVGQRDKP